MQEPSAFLAVMGPRPRVDAWLRREARLADIGPWRRQILSLLAAVYLMASMPGLPADPETSAAFEARQWMFASFAALFGAAFFFLMTVISQGLSD